ncbi:MAG: agmatinase family protein [Parvularculaceae bacterium]
MQDAALSECRSWRSLADLLTTDVSAPVALIGAPLNEKSLTPGRCDLAPKVLREAMKRFSVFDVETGADLSAVRVLDAGDLFLKTLTPEQSFSPIRDGVLELVTKRQLTIVAGGNNAITRGGVHGLGPLGGTGLITLDAHFDLRDTDCGLTNGNPVRALIEDGLPGANIVQIGLAPFANTQRAFDFAMAQGIAVRTIADVKACGAVALIEEAIEQLSGRCERLYVDFDIDVIDRAQCPGAPGARPGGMTADEFFAAARAVGACSAVAAVDLTEFDPSLDVSDITALTAGRWLAELLAGFAGRK